MTDLMTENMGKVIIGLGLLLDLIGVVVLLSNEINLRRIELLEDISLEKQSFLDIYEAGKEGTRLGSTKESKLAQSLSKNHSSKKALRLSRLGLVLLSLGFLLQMIGLFL